MTTRGSPNWKRKRGEPTKVVRLPQSIVEAVKQELQSGTPLAEIADKAVPQAAGERTGLLSLTIVQAVRIAFLLA